MPEVDLSELELLKGKLLAAKRFADVWDWFMTHFGERRDFMMLGDKVRHPQLEGALVTAAEAALGEKVAATEVMLIHLPKQRFIHGALMLGGKMSNVFFFEDIGVGLLTIVVSLAGDTKLLRFTARSERGKLARQ